MAQRRSKRPPKLSPRRTWSLGRRACDGSSGKCHATHASHIPVRIVLLGLAPYPTRATGARAIDVASDQVAEESATPRAENVADFLARTVDPREIRWADRHGVERLAPARIDGAEPGHNRRMPARRIDDALVLTGSLLRQRGAPPAFPAYPARVPRRTLGELTLRDADPRSIRPPPIAGGRRIRPPRLSSMRPANSPHRPRSGAGLPSLRWLVRIGLAQALEETF
jgi:hypothetical protein